MPSKTCPCGWLPPTEVHVMPSESSVSTEIDTDIRIQVKCPTPNCPNTYNVPKDLVFVYENYTPPKKEEPQ